MSNPEISGTAYTVIQGILQTMGGENGWHYLESLHRNIREYTRRGNGPPRRAARGDVIVGIAPGIEPEWLDGYTTLTVYFDGPPRSEGTPTPFISFLSPVRGTAGAESNRDSPVIGYIRFVMPITALTDQVVGDVALADPVVIINRRGEIVFHRNPAEIGSNLLKYAAFKDRFLVFSNFAANGLLQINVFVDKKRLAQKTAGIRDLTASIRRQVNTINELSSQLKAHLEALRR